MKKKFDLTLIIPTYNRSKWLSSTLKIMGNFNVNILVMDGSTNKKEIDVNRSLIAEINEKKGKSIIKHITSNSSFFCRVNMAANLVDTKYSKICADDDLFSINFLDDAINKLENRSDISSVEGGIVSFDVEKQKFISFTHQYHDDLASSELFIRGTARTSRTGVFGVMPSNILKLCSSLSMMAEELIVKKNNDDKSIWAAYRVMELIYRTVIILSGPIARSNNLMLLRFYHGDNLGGKLAKKNKHATYFLDKNINYYLDILCNQMASDLDIPIDNVRAVVLYDYFSDISNRLTMIKSDIRSSAKFDISNQDQNKLNNNFFHEILMAHRSVIKLIRQTFNKGDRLKVNAKLLKKEAENLLNKIQIH